MQIIPDLTFTAFMLMPFAFTFMVVRFLLVSPMLEYLEGREAAIGGARNEAKALEAQVEEKLSELEIKLDAARKEAAGVRAEVRERGLANERGILEAARTDADEKVTAAVAEISAEATAARGSLEGMAKSISVDIAGRVLGRTIQA